MRSAPRVLACHMRVFHFRAPALPAQQLLGGGFGRGAKPPSEWNVQRVRLACGRRAPPCSWTLLIALARAFLRQASSPAGRGRRRFTSLARLTLPSTIWPGVIDARPLAVQEQPGQAGRLRQGGEPPFRVRRPTP